MREIVDALRFRGLARRLGPDGNVVAMATTAPSCTVHSRVGVDGLTAKRELGRGNAAICDAELILTGDAAFQQTATVAFGDRGDVLRLSTVGTGYLGPAPVSEARQGAAIWQVDGGDGQFAGAVGMVVSTFVLSDAGEVTDHHLGVVYVR